ncbi:MAG TPA: FGGY-family carbohydrate kinase, partial [Candidatus Eisenbacteria bacterium]|nr:FGGY-family carbohydrate kinase [Candidatus Eisenbacteria bacterium]
TLTPKSGYIERDMHELWEINVKVIQETIKKSNISAADIIGVSFSGHGKGLYLVDKNGESLYRGIPSSDARAWAYVDKWNKDGTAEKVYPKTYQNILASQPVSILAWLKDNEPDIYQNIGHVFSVKDYIRYKITGVANAEYTDFSGANLINLNTKKYDFELLEYFGIPEIEEKLPALKYSAEISGFVTDQASELTGLAKGTPVAAGMFDINACGVASGLGDTEKLTMIAGTWSINEFIREEPVTNGIIALNSMYCMPGYYLIEESSPTSAGNLEWFIQTLLPERKKQAKIDEKSIYADVDAWVEEIDPADSDLIFLPFINGSNEDALAKGTLIGLTMYHNRKHITRAVFEGVVFSHLTHLNKLLKIREKPDSIQLSGGAANSDVWVQIFADVLQIPIDVVADKEQGAQGAAMAAGIAVGAYKDYADAINKCVKISRTVEPRPEYADIYQEKYKKYRAVIGGLSDVWKLFKN